MTKPGLTKDAQKGIFTMAALLKKQGLADLNPVVHESEDGMTVRRKQAVVLRTTPITWGIPFDEVCFSKAWKSSLMLRPMPWDSMMFTEHTYLAKARETIHNQFIDEGVNDWLFMMDSDVACPPDYIVRLLAHHKADPSKKVLAGWYRVKSEPFYPVVYHYVGAKMNFKDIPIEWWKHYELDEMKPELIEVDGAGAGGWLIHREVLEKIGHDPFDMHAGGEDLQLCRLITKAGYKMFVDGSLKLAHIGVGVA